MRIFLIIFSFLLISSSFIYSQEKKVKVDGVNYIVDIEKGTASVGKNYRERLFKHYSWVGILEGDIVLASNITYKKKDYPVTSIGANAFMSCDKLNSITIPCSISKIKYSSFTNITNLKQIVVTPDNPYFLSKNGILFSKDMSRIYRFPSGRNETSYIIPPEVVSIEANAFSFCINLKNIQISENVKYIKSEAFEYCDFKTIIIPNSVIEIEDKVFYWCTDLTSIKLPFNVSKVGSKAFYYCNNLNSVTYQNKNLVFSSDAFEDCKKLNSNKIIYEVPKSLFLELAHKGNTEYQYQLAICYLTEDDFPKDFKVAKEWFMKASEKGHTLSQKSLGDIYFNGIGVEKNYQEAVKWYSLAAKGGNASAQSILGDCYFRGIGVKQDFPTSINYYKLAANQGDNNAENALGHCYYFGNGGVKKDYIDAVMWYSLSANKGNAEAAYYLACCYNEGQGIEKNNSEALKWIEKAVEGGIEKSQAMYCILAYEDAVNSMNSKYYSSAISRFTSLLKYDKDNIDAYINRGYCYLNQQAKDYKSAENDFKKALELNSNNETAKNNLQVVTEYYQRIKDAKELCEIGYQCSKRGDYTRAVANCTKSISLDNTNPYPYYLIGYCYNVYGQYPDAINFFNQALSVDPNYTKAINARKSAKAMMIINAINQVSSAVSNSLNSAYNSSLNYSNSSSYKSSSNSSSSATSQRTSSLQLKRKTCNSCKGTGRVESSVATYGSTESKWCDYCKRSVPASHCCQCKVCPACGGKGYTESY
ncbi:MAG: leucine-rich repeat protein [Bacteroidales bacterium]